MTIENLKSFSFEYFNDEFYFLLAPAAVLGTALATSNASSALAHPPTGEKHHEIIRNARDDRGRRSGRF